MLKIRNLRTRDFQYYIGIDPKGMFIGFIWSIGSTEVYTCSCTAVKILTSFNKSTVHVSLAPQPLEPEGRCTAGRMLAQALTALLWFHPQASPDASPGGQ